jgi:UDP-N-acetylglucosamine--N-acetylmuramyl-(pentapeptide) pyrophosphoryl-undecaprenol N-acetylglucosamine transferase
MNVIIAAGGTGGHFYPGLAEARYLLKKGDQVRFIVKKNDYVGPLLERENIPFSAISAAGFNRRWDIKNLLIPFKLIFGLFQALRALHQFKTDVLLVMGGYLSVAPAVAAKVLSIPVVLHEQNVKPGLANRILSRLARRVAISFHESAVLFPCPTQLTGNPIRPEFEHIPKRELALPKWNLSPEKKTLLIFGGSLGAKALNSLVIETISKLGMLSKDVQILHFTGPQDEARVKEAYGKTPFQFFVASYVHDMVSAYAVADLILCRAGATTVAELRVVQRPTVFIPFPYATENHQLDNARTLAKIGAAQVYEEKDLTPLHLKEILEKLLTDADALRDMREGYRGIELDPLAAASNIYDLLAGLVRK